MKDLHPPTNCRILPPNINSTWRDMLVSHVVIEFLSGGNNLGPSKENCLGPNKEN